MLCICILWSKILTNILQLNNFYFSSKLCYFLNLFFTWRIIALQSFVVFCQIWAWISHRYTYIPSLLNLLPISLPFSSPSHPFGLIQSPCLFPELYSKFPLAVYFTYGNVSFHVTLSIHLTLSSPLPMSISLLSMSVSSLVPWK